MITNTTDLQRALFAELEALQNEDNYKDKDGKLYDINEKSSYSKKINEYATIQYNGFVDYKNRINEIFYLKGSKSSTENQ